jgi:hypothetical protein
MPTLPRLRALAVVLIALALAVPLDGRPHHLAGA